MKKMIKNAPLKAVLLLLVIAALLFSGVQTTRAALTVQSNYYQVQANMQDIGVALLENGSIVAFSGKSAPGRLFSGKPVVFATGEEGDFHYGVRYKEELAVQNTGSIEQFVRVVLTRYWCELDEDGNVAVDADGCYVKYQALDPELIEMHFTGNGWSAPQISASKEQLTLYYTANGGKLAPGAVSAPFVDSIIVNGNLTGIAKTEEVRDGVKVYTYIYDGKAFVIEAETQSVQTHNAEDAVGSAWGSDAFAIIANSGADTGGGSVIVNPVAEEIIEEETGEEIREEEIREEEIREEETREEETREEETREETGTNTNATEVFG